MKKFFSVFAMIFGFMGIASAQNIGFPVPGTGPVITDISESWDGVVSVEFTNDYFPVTLVVNGDTAVLEQDEYIGFHTFEVEPVRGQFYRRTYNAYASSLRGSVNRTATFFDMKKVKDDDAYFYNKKKHALNQVPVETLDDEGIEVIVQDYRKPLPVQGDPSFEELGSDAGFDTLLLEYEYTPEYDVMPQFVESIDSQGNVFRRNIKFLQTGLRTGEKAGVMIVGTIIRATPYSVKPGEKNYNVTLVMRDGKKLKRKLVVLTDHEEPL